jgi:hypothetical protein
MNSTESLESSNFCLKVAIATIAIINGTDFVIVETDFAFVRF